MKKFTLLKPCVTAVFSVIFLITVVSIVPAKAQTLEFSSIKLVSTLSTVPAGKVWKVISVASSSAQALSIPSDCSANSNSTQIAVNGTTIHISARYAMNSTACFSSYSAGVSVTSTGDLTQLPLWLPEGTTLATGTGAAFVSIIEFSVI